LKLGEVKRLIYQHSELIFVMLLAVSEYLASLVDLDLPHDPAVVICLEKVCGPSPMVVLVSTRLVPLPLEVPHRLPLAELSFRNPGGLRHGTATLNAMVGSTCYV
jgi:hypothetical protein